MFISKEELENKKAIAKLDGYNEGLKKLAEHEKKFSDSKIPLSTYYTERLEWWKKQFDKEPENHKLRIDWNDNYEIIEKNNLHAIIHTLDEFKEQKDFVTFEDFETGQMIVIPVNQIQNYTVIPGHPDPYTSEEIEVWAKKQLEKEMQGWTVVKEQPLTAMEVTTLNMPTPSYQLGIFQSLYEHGYFGKDNPCQ